MNHNLSIRRTCCAGVDSVTDCDYNNYIENPKNVLKKVQSAFCPLLALFQANYQNILKNTCRNEPGKQLNKPVPGRQGRNEHRPIKGIDTPFLQPRPYRTGLRRNEHRPIEGIDTPIHQNSSFPGVWCRNENRPIKGIDTVFYNFVVDCNPIVEMSIARLRALTQSSRL